MVESISQNTEEATPTFIPSSTLTVTSTPTETETPEPTTTPTLEPTYDSTLVIAKNFVAEKEDNGVKVEVVRILIGNKETFEKNFDIDFSDEK